MAKLYQIGDLFFLVGGYKIDVLHGSRPIRGSPFLCQVYDASKVKIENIPNSTVSVNDNIMFKRKLQSPDVQAMSLALRIILPLFL